MINKKNPKNYQENRVLFKTYMSAERRDSFMTEQFL